MSEIEMTIDKKLEKKIIRITWTVVSISLFLGVIAMFLGLL
jgi:hypothetical protein